MRSYPLVEDHSGGYRIEPIWPDGVLVGYRPGEVRPAEFRPWFDRVAVDLHGNDATRQPAVRVARNPETLESKGISEPSQQGRERG